MIHAYPRLKKLGVPIHDVEGYLVVSWVSLDAALSDKDRQCFGELFGVQTCVEAGCFAYDAEAVLERMASGKLVGTQLDWD